MGEFQPPDIDDPRGDDERERDMVLWAFKKAVHEIEMYVDLMQKLDYIEYAARTQKELDSINIVIAKVERW